MSWLFCCGSSDAQKNIEKRNTLDLSKPITGPVRTSKAEEQFELEGLSGEPSDKSKQLTALLSLKDQQKRRFTVDDQVVREGGVGGEGGQRGEDMPFQIARGARAGTLNTNTSVVSREHGGRSDSLTMNSQRMLTDKKLGIYLQQAQKIIQRKSQLNANLSLNNEESFDNSFGNSNNSHQNIVVSGMGNDLPNSSKGLNTKSSIDLNKVTRIPEYDEEGKGRPKKRQSEGGSKLALTKINADKQKSQYIATSPDEPSNKNANYGNIKFTSQSTKNQMQKSNPFKPAKTLTSKGYTKPQITTQNKNSANNTQIAIKSSHDPSTAPTTKQQPSSTKSGNAMKGPISGAKQPVAKINNLKRNLTIETVGESDQYHFPKSKTATNKESAIVKASVVQIDTSNLEPDQIFPSSASEFSFQPKYFKPNSTKAAGDFVNSLTSSNNTQGFGTSGVIGNQNSRLFESTLSPNQHKKSSMPIGVSESIFVVVHTGPHGGDSETQQTTPGYSASSTIIPVTCKLGSIVPKGSIPSVQGQTQSTQATQEILTSPEEKGKEKGEKRQKSKNHSKIQKKAQPGV